VFILGGRRGEVVIHINVSYRSIWLVLDFFFSPFESHLERPIEVKERYDINGSFCLSHSALVMSNEIVLITAWQCFDSELGILV
jgi:hypothetical protein